MREVAPGIYQVELPLPFPLRIVNVYLLRDDPGWTLVDTGLHYPAGRAAWAGAFAELGIGPAQIRRIVLTHAHPDHYGMAGWLQAESGAPVLASAPEQRFARAQWQAGSDQHAQIAAFFGSHGMPDELMSTVAADITALRAMTQPAPTLELLAEGAALAIGGRRFTTIATPGHSAGHMVLACPDEHLLLCGDAVLIKITPNVGLWEPEGGDPLAAFLRSLGRLAELDVALALPGHGPLITHFRERLAQLAAHHVDRLAAVEAAAGEGATAFAVCTAVFPLPELTSHQVRFAMAETLAHLQHLVALGRVVATAEAPVCYRRV